MAFLVGLIFISATLYGFTLVIEWALIKRVMDSPANGFMASLFLACAVFCALWNLNTELVSVGSIIAPFACGIPIALVKLPKYLRLRKAEANSVNDVDAFR